MVFLFSAKAFCLCSLFSACTLLYNSWQHWFGAPPVHSLNHLVNFLRLKISEKEKDGSVDELGKKI